MGLMALTLERSKAAPLQLWLDSCLFSRSWFCDLITPYIQTIETLKFDQLATVEHLSQTLPNFPQSTPNLRLLSLILEDGEPGWDPSIDPFGLFPGALRSLTLDDIPLYPSFLELRTLRVLSLRYHTVRPPLDALLDVLEENRSLESVDLRIYSDEYPAQVSLRRAVVLNQLHRLMVTCWDATIARILISNIPLRKGAHLGITLRCGSTGLGLKDILSGISMTRLSNLPSPRP